MDDAVDLSFGEESDGDGLADVEVDTAVVLREHTTSFQQALPPQWDIISQRTHNYTSDRLTRIIR